MRECIKQYLVRRQDYANVLEDEIPSALVSPVIHVVLSREYLNAVARQIRLKNFMLLLAESNGRREEPDELNCKNMLHYPWISKCSHLVRFASLQFHSCTSKSSEVPLVGAETQLEKQRTCESCHSLCPSQQ
jgi:hypothetical protein